MYKSKVAFGVNCEQCSQLLNLCGRWSLYFGFSSVFFVESSRSLLTLWLLDSRVHWDFLIRGSFECWAAHIGATSFCWWWASLGFPVGTRACGSCRGLCSLDMLGRQIGHALRGCGRNLSGWEPFGNPAPRRNQSRKPSLEKATTKLGLLRMKVANHANTIGSDFLVFVWLVICPFFSKSWWWVLSQRHLRNTCLRCEEIGSMLATRRCSSTTSCYSSASNRRNFRKSTICLCSDLKFLALSGVQDVQCFFFSVYVHIRLLESSFF